MHTCIHAYIHHAYIQTIHACIHTYIILHYITLHYITVHYSAVHTYIHTMCIYIYIYIIYHDRILTRNHLLNGTLEWCSDWANPSYDFKISWTCPTSKDLTLDLFIQFLKITGLDASEFGVKEQVPSGVCIILVWDSYCQLLPGCFERFPETDWHVFNA